VGAQLLVDRRLADGGVLDELGVAGQVHDDLAPGVAQQPGGLGDRLRTRRVVALAIAQRRGRERAQDDLLERGAMLGGAHDRAGPRWGQPVGHQ